MSFRRCTEEKKRLKKLFLETGTSIPCGCWYDDDKNRYFKESKSRGRNSSWAIGKKLSRRIIRRHSKLTGCWENKSYDLWWNEY